VSVHKSRNTIIIIPSCN